MSVDLDAPPENESDSLLEPSWLRRFLVVRVDDRLMVFRGDRPQCVAEMSCGARCQEDVTRLFCGWVNIQILGSDAFVIAQLSALPSECFIRQRCPRHVYAGGADETDPAGEWFSPSLHADALFRVMPQWHDGRILDPGERGTHQAIQFHHAAVCPFGDHVPWGLSQEDAMDELGERPPSRNFLDQQQWERRRWADFIDGHIPEMAAQLPPPTSRVLLHDPRDGGPVPAPPSLLHSDPPGLREPEPDVPTALYRYFDKASVMLYIGISGSLGVRTGSHARKSSWMDFAASSTIERFPSRPAALAAEKAAIEAEHPLFNDQYNRTREAQARLVEYLIAHGRADLLVPSVSRG